jgi:hypothetical protein
MRGGNFQKQESVPKIRNFYIEPTNIWLTTICLKGYIECRIYKKNIEATIS